MKVSIWQQFSSNHSAHFTIVGIFRSPDDAANSAQQLRDFLDDLLRWHEDHPDESQEMREHNIEGVITGPEKKAATEYSIEWTYPVLWMDNYFLDVFDRFIFVSNNWGADSGAEPVDQLIRKLGADEVFVSGSMIWNADDRRLDVKISSFAPTPETARLLSDELNGRPGEDEHYVQVFLDDFAMNDSQTLKDILVRMKNARCTHIHVMFEEHRGYTLSLA
jgi:hypothetical protein